MRSHGQPRVAVFAALGATLTACGAGLTACAAGSRPVLQSAPPPAAEPSGPAADSDGSIARPVPAAQAPESSQTSAQPGSPSPSPSRSAPLAGAVLSANERAVLTAYQNFFRATRNALRAPTTLTQAPTPEADFTRWAFDPLRTQYQLYVAGLAERRVAFRGEAPTPRASVVSVAMNDKPYPTAVVSDCLKQSSTWHEYVIATGQIVPPRSSPAPAPHRVTSTLVFYQGRWGVAQNVADTSVTCSA